MKTVPFVIAFASLVALSILAAPAKHGDVAVAATPTPTPVALQYDQISRFIVAPATPPAPGSFSEDFQLAMSASPMPGSPGSNAATPAPKHRGLGGLVGGMIPGMSSGNPGDASAGAAPAGAMAMMNMMRTGHLMRYTFYYTKGWIREDDPLAQTATISKCNEHIFITLDLAKKTYTQTSTQPAGGNCVEMPSMSGGRPGGGSPQANTAPGTEDLTISAKSQNLGPKTIEGIATSGNSSDLSMASTNATGSCQNAQFGMSTVTYISQIGKPRAYCPLSSRPAVATDPTQVAARGGCKPAIHGSPGSMSAMNGNKLEMYILLNYNSQESRGHAVGMLTERGHVAWLYTPQADQLFSIPPDFTAAQ
jgi:hypothetical protein